MARHRRRPARRWPRLLITALMVLMVLAAGLVITLRVSGVHLLAEQSGSMSPSIETGDLVLSRQIPARSAAVGDVVTFPDPDGEHVLITHRVTAVDTRGDTVVVTTRGDANTGTEVWSTTADATIGRAAAVVPHLGRVLFPFGSPAVTAAFTAAATALIAWLALGLLRRRR